MWAAMLYGGVYYYKGLLLFKGCLNLSGVGKKHGAETAF